MTSKTTKSLLLAVMLTAIIVPLILANNADAAASNQGKTVIETEFTKPIKSESSELIALDEAFGKSETDKERQLIKAQAGKIMLKRAPSTFDDERATMYLEAKDVLVDAIGTMPQIDGQNAIPYTRAGYSSETRMLTIHIHQDFATLENMEKYEKTIRSIVGKEIDLKLTNGGDYWQLGTCNNGPLNDCSPLESGVEMQVTCHNTCTIGNFMQK